MRRSSVLGGVALGLVVLGGTVIAGCYDSFENCYLSASCPPPPDAGDGGTPVGCVPSLNEEAAGDTCGVFVATSGNDGGTGMKSEPLKTLGAAIARAQENGTRRVYACAETFEEAVEVPGGVTVFGGLDCANGWAWIGQTTRTTVTAAEGVIPLRMTGGEGAVHIEDVEAVARSIDATATPELLGASSIAAVANGGSVELVRCVLVAGDAADGEAGAPGAPRDMNGDITPAAAGADGNPGGEACSASQVVGGEPPLNDCGTRMDDTDDSIGGGGGTGTLASGQDGSDGFPGGSMNMNRGTGETSSSCTDGQPGAVGAMGDPGDGASGLGTINASGYAGLSGSDGSKGAPGQGGGGGGGAKGGTGANQCMAGMAGGASGGSGASGGCGGVGGKGGGAGGASIALISLNASLTFDTVTLRTGRGGTGGTGGEPQPGGLGGVNGGAAGTKGSASALNDACAGGPGGKGGDGGRGGGGLGGHSIGIAYQGTAPPAEGVTIETGDAGLGGNGADEQHNGAAGVKASVQVFQP